MSLAKQEFTDAGRSMLGRAQAGEILHVTKLVVGSGAAATPSQLWPLTHPIIEEHLFNISAKRDYGQGTLLVEGSFRSDQVGTAFLMRELGVYAHIGNEADRLYSISNVFAEQPDNVDPASPSVHSFKVKLVIDRIPTDQLTVSIGPTENVLGENVGADTVGPGVYKEAAGNVLRFKRLIQGTAMDIHEEPVGSPNADAIYIGASTLKNDLDLYVPVNYPGITDQKVLFPTIQAAHDHLLQYFIPPDKHARIHVWKGSYPKANFTHPNSLQIELHGWPRVDKPIQVINWLNNATSPPDPRFAGVTVGGSSGNKNISFVAGTDISDLVVGQIVYLAECGWGWIGGCKIVAKAGAIVTCDVPDQSNMSQHYTTQSSRNNYTTQRLSYYPTVIDWVNPTPGARPLEHCLAFPYGIGLVENILAVGARNAFGAGADMALKNCMAWGAVAGCGSFTGMCQTGEDYVATHCENGSGGPGMLWHQNVAMINGCGSGVSPGYNGCALASINTALTTWWLHVNHCNVGIRMTLNASAYGSHYLYGLNNYGVYMDIGCCLNLNILLNFPYQNTTKDLYCYGNSFISYKQDAAQGVPAPTCSPATNPGNAGSWIDVVP